MIGFLVLSIIIFTFLIASFEDIRKREVYDYINFSLAFFIILIGIFDSLVSSSLDPIKYVGFGLLVGFAFGSLFYYIGMWGGGDAKFLIGFSGASYYLMDFMSVSGKHVDYYKLIMELLSGFFKMFIDTFLKFIIYLDIFFMFLLFILFLKTKNKYDRKNMFSIFTMLFLLFIGLFMDYSVVFLVIIGFIVFLLIFFADDYVFSSSYIRLRRYILDIKEGDIPDDGIKYGKKELFEYEDVRAGFSKEQLNFLKEKCEDRKEIYVRKIIPYSTLIGLNFIVYLFNIISLDDFNLWILSFNLQFLILSFLAGGVLSIGIILYQFIRNFNKINLKISKRNHIMVLGFSLFVLLLSLLSMKFIVFLVFVPIIYFMFIAKEIEKFVFVKKKPLENITLGDWIVQDIEVGNKLIFSKDDFKLGVDEFQLEKIKSLAKSHKYLKELWVKDGIAFLPPLFAGFLFMILF